MPLRIHYGDITEERVDAIVNPTNHRMVGTGGTDGAIHRKAGQGLEEELSGAPFLETGDVFVTKGYGLEAKYIIHTVGPRWMGGDEDEAILLRSCYTNSLFEAVTLGCSSIAFPLISSGTFQFPSDYASSIAVEAITNFLRIKPELEVILVVYPKGPASPLFDGLARYIEENFSGHFVPTREREEIPSLACYDASPVFFDADEGLEEQIEEEEEEEEEDTLDLECRALTSPLWSPLPPDWKPGDPRLKLDGFVDVLMHFVNKYLAEHKDEKESGIYKRALLTRAHYSKIKSEKIMPRKYT
ncbi:MAG: macro domain-containing protein, partial [Spirochaetales bacterium]|nr:macro domain-containing protein [Candidatus Physcosoma equi]